MAHAAEALPAAEVVDAVHQALGGAMRATPIIESLVTIEASRSSDQPSVPAA